LYSRFQLARKYLKYYFTASSGRGYGIHSPFVFDFVENVLHEREDFASYHQIDQLRSMLLKNRTPVEFQDLGAGLVSHEIRNRTIADITRRSGKNRKFGRLLFRIAHYYQPSAIVEMGTSLGLSTAYLAAGSPAAKLVTMEGAGAVAIEAKKNFEWLGLKNIEVVTGSFEDSLPVINSAFQPAELIFMDGNHRKEPTLRYFNKLLEFMGSSSLIILDDIHWSQEMESAWTCIKADTRVLMTIDLFFIGLVFFRKSFKIKQHFTIRF
jgi:predicted O-methyltransferase YrrM